MYSDFKQRSQTFEFNLGGLGVLAVKIKALILNVCKRFSSVYIPIFAPI